MKRQKITLVELPPTSFGRLNASKVKDIYTRFKLPARANPLLQAILLNEGYGDVKSIDPNVNWGGKLTRHDLKRITESDYLLLSAITRTIPQTKELAQIYRKANPQGKIIAGGPHVTFMPEETLEWADFVVRHEGDKTLVELLETLENNKSLEGVKGISYVSGNKIINNECREFLTEEELDLLPNPDFSIYSKKTKGVVNTSRGCPYGCNFCSVTNFYGKGYRRKSNLKILEEINAVGEKNNDFFGDDNFGTRKSPTKELLRELIKIGNKTKYTCQLSVNSAFLYPEGNDIDEEFLSLLKQANFFAVCLGVESINKDTLKGFNKSATVERNKIAVKEFRKAGLWEHVMMMVGGDSDTNESLDETLDWSMQYADSVQFFAPLPLPGTPFTSEMEKQGRILTKDYYLYDGFHVIIEPKNFSPYGLQMKIWDMNSKFYSIKKNPFIKDSAYPWYKEGVHLYAQKIAWDISHDPQTREYFERLKEME